MYLGLFVSLLISYMVYRFVKGYDAMSSMINNLKQDILNNVDRTSLQLINDRYDLISNFPLVPSHVKRLNEVRELLKQLNLKYKFTTYVKY